VALAPWLSAATLLASLAFAAVVLRRWRAAHKSHQLLWGAALLLFALASALEVQGALQGWGALGYKAYFILTAVMVGLMAAGTAFLLSPHLGRGFTAFVAVVAEAMALFLLVSPADAARLAEASAAGDVPTRVLGGLGTLHAMVDIPAALLLIGGALQGWRRTRSPGMLLIAAGAVAFTGIHSLASGAQTGLVAVSGADLFSAGSLVGVLLLFAGYARSREAPRPAEPEASMAVAHG
jgi:hypothetical protein